MQFYIKSKYYNYIKLKLKKKNFDFNETIRLTEYIKSFDNVIKVRIYNKIGEIKIIVKDGNFENIISKLKSLTYSDLTKFSLDEQNYNKALELYEIKKKVIKLLVFRFIARRVLPRPLSMVRTIYKTISFIRIGINSLLNKRFDVSVLDATAITVSIIRRDYKTANSIIFLLRLSELLEEYTHKKVVAELTRSLKINVKTVWLYKDGNETEVNIDLVDIGDNIIIRSGGLIPFDGIVIKGSSVINQASLTGESIGVKKSVDDIVYAGTVIEEGEIVYCITSSAGNNRIDEVINLIENSENNQSKQQIKAYSLSDSLVKYNFLGFALTYAITRNFNRALSFLMVDYSCAIKLTTPIAIMTAMKQCTENRILVKGGKYLENIANANAILFDKTGTLTKSTPKVQDIIGLNGYSKREVLRLAACLEEHFPHSLAKAVVNKALEEHVNHDEMHGHIEYIVAHGVASTINNKKVVIGSHHFIFDDEGVEYTDDIDRVINDLPKGRSYLYLAMENKLIGILVIEDPIKTDAKVVIKELKNRGFKKIVMLTGDNYNTAKEIAKEVGIDEFIANVLPADKSTYVENLKAEGNVVIMVGDGINDSPALSYADVGISMSQGSDIAKEVSDVVINEDKLESLLILRDISTNVQKRIRKSNNGIVLYNSNLIFLGLFNIIKPNSSALLHNFGTLFATLNSMKPIKDNITT